MIDFMDVTRVGILLILIRASYDDIKTREVDNMYWMAGFVVIIFGAFFSVFQHQDPSLFYKMPILCVIGAALGYGSWRQHYWGAADGKCLGICIGSLFTITAVPVFLVMIIPVLLFYEYFGEAIFSKPYPFVPGITVAYLGMTMILATS